MRKSPKFSPEIIERAMRILRCLQFNTFNGF